MISTGGKKNKISPYRGTCKKRRFATIERESKKGEKGSEEGSKEIQMTSSVAFAKQKRRWKKVVVVETDAQNCGHNGAIRKGHKNPNKKTTKQKPPNSGERGP